tara:strand:+ start:1558 stop:1911 length:354 start_codon:yes stop_codon:yes gene_type:complete
MISILTFEDKRGREPYMEYLNGLKDFSTRIAIEKEVRKLEKGLVSNVKAIKHQDVQGLKELRISRGCAHRVYFVNEGQEIIILLAAGRKADQKRDIERAVENYKELKQQKAAIRLPI